MSDITSTIDDGGDIDKTLVDSVVEGSEVFDTDIPPLTVSISYGGEEGADGRPESQLAEQEVGHRPGISDPPNEAVSPETQIELVQYKVEETGADDGGTQPDHDDHDIIFDPGSDLLPPTTLTGPAQAAPVSPAFRDTADDDAQDGDRAAGGPHQGQHDIGGYVPTNVAAPSGSAKLGGDAEDSFAKAKLSPTLLLATDGKPTGSGAQTGTSEAEIALTGVDATNANGTNIKGLSWFGFETEAVTSSDSAEFHISNKRGTEMFWYGDTGADVDATADLAEAAPTDTQTASSPGHYTQVAWARTRAELDAGPAYIEGVHAPAAGANFIEGTEDHDDIHGTEGRDDIHTYGGIDFVYAYGGDDYVNAGGGSDEVYGGSGDDILKGAGGADLLEGGTGSDELSGGAENDQLFGGDGNDVLRGGQGVDRIEGGSGADVHRWESEDSGEDNIYGFQLGVDTLEFSSGFFETGPGDTLNDVLLALDSGADTQLLAKTAWGDWQMLGTFHDVDAAEFQARIDNGTILETGTPMAGGPDEYTPEQRDPLEDEAPGSVVLVEPAEHPTRGDLQEFDTSDASFVGVWQIGTEDADLMVGTENDDIFFASDGEDIVSGAVGNDQLYGQNDGDILFGGAGDDFLSGGDGNDNLTGGAGADTFNFEASGGFAHNPGSDTITDFELGVDSFAFEDGFFNAEPGDILADNLIAVQGVGGTELFADMNIWGVGQIAFVENIDAADLQLFIDNEMILA